MSQLNAERKTVEVLAEEFVARYRRGERPALAEYIDAHPELADEIRELFPTLVMMEELAPDSSGISLASTTVPAQQPILALGDYRILREIGRGGMGIVYEAEQLSLGRRVALKVLRYASGDSTVRQRFHREARAAAQLHHTNIVPVFEVGEDQDACWYAMQLILGQGLDQIIDELRQQRQPRSEGRQPLTQVTQALVSGKFACPDLDASTPPPANAESPREQASLDSSDSSRLASRSELSIGDSASGQYYRSVARIGRQAAEALAHAHTRGIIHRDVKPSNLLLDTAGVVWITDFGLAKTQENSLTTTGDVVGTLRYMAPERFKGEGDERADVYGLGLTLYELLVLRPAFAARDRLQLIDQIKNQEPARPREEDRRMPRDLETILLKAIHKEAKQRYQTAEEMAEDLRRFLADEPIKAKRISRLARLRLWSRRNPALAALLLVLALVAAASTAAAFYLRATLLQSDANLQLAEKEKLEGKQKLWLSYLSQALARRMSRQSGQRLASLRAIKEALALPVPPDRSREELRTEAIAGLCLPDLEFAWEGGAKPLGAIGLTIDPAFQRYAWPDKDGNVRIHRLSDDQELLPLPGSGSVDGYYGLGFSPDGRFLIHICNTPHGVRSRLWDLDTPKPKAVRDDNHGALAFRPDSRQYAAVYPDGTIRFFETATHRERRRFPVHLEVDRGLHWNPKLPQLLVASRMSLRLLNMDTGEGAEVGPKIPGGYAWVAWHPEGRLLAVSGELDRKIYLWDVPTGRLVMPPLEEHKNGGVVMCFNHAGDRLLSTDWNGSGHLWDARSGRLLLTVPDFRPYLSFSPDDRLVGTRDVRSTPHLYYFRRGEELRTLVHRGQSRGYNAGFFPCPDAEGRLFAIYIEDVGVALVDVARGEEAALLPLPGNVPLRFDSEGALWTHGSAGLLCWPMAVDPKTGQRRYGPPRRVFSPTNGELHGSSTDARVVAIPDYGRGAIVFHRNGKRLLRLGPQEDVRNCAVSPDGRWVATGSWGLREGAGAKVWDAKDGRHIKDLPVGGLCNVRFSPDGKWLLTITGGIPRLWAVGTWEEGANLGGKPSITGAFTRDGKLLALGDDAFGVIRLVVPDSGEEIARLTAPAQTRLMPCVFTPDGAQLIAVGAETSFLYIFDLRAIRAGLAELDLDWDAPPYPSATGPKNPPPLQISIDMGSLVPQEPPQQAVIKYSLALAVLPINPVAYLRRGLAYYQLKQWRQAADDLGLALALDPSNKDSQAWLELGSACLGCGRPKEAAAAYSRVIQLGAGDAEVYNGRSVAYYCLGLWDKAIADLEKALKLQPDFPVGNNNLAWNLANCPEAKFRDPARAVKLAKQAVALQPKEGFCWTTLGVAHYRAGDWKAARKALEKSLELGQGEGNIFWFGRTTLFLAMSHCQLGEKEKARASYRQAVEWMGKNQPELEKDQGRWNELRRFRAEADAVLSEPPGRAKK